MAFSEAAVAQQRVVVPDEAIFNGQVKPLADVIAEMNADAPPKSSAGAIQVMNWLIYGSIGFGTAYDSNLSGSSSDGKSATGLRVTPSFVAVHDTGIQKTELYGVGDVAYYPSQKVTNFQDSRLGLLHIWHIQRDFTFRIQGEAGRNNEITSLINLDNKQLGVPDEPINYWTSYGSTSLEKGFGRFFVGLGGSVLQENFENSEDGFGNPVDEEFRNGTLYTLSNRVGYYITPISYIFAEPSLEWQRYSIEPEFNSDGGNIKVGIGTQRISLFNGEIYGGYYSRDFNDPNLGDINSPLFGGRISWVPTRTITVSASLDHRFGTSDYYTGDTPIGSLTSDYVSSLRVSWDITESITLAATSTYDNADFVDSIRHDKLFMNSIQAIYYFRNGFGLTATYTNYDRNSNVIGGGYNRNFFSFGATRRF